MQIIAGSAPIDLAPFDTWDLFPPQLAKLTLGSSVDAKLGAVGNFQVVLSFGPNQGYTMAWAIESYMAIGVPFVGQGISIAEPTNATASRAEAEEAATTGIKLGDGDILVWCDTLLLLVTDLALGPAPTSATEDDRLAALLDRPTSSDENRDLYQTMLSMGIADHVLETMLFVLVLDEEELELSRNTVTTEDLPDFVRLYHLMPTWPQRCAVAYVAQDHGDDILTDIRVNVLKAPRPIDEPLSICHIAQAASLAWLRGSIDLMSGYLDDPDQLDEHGALWASLQSD